MAELFDALNHPLPVEPLPRRIVSLVPSLTELLCFLGAERAIVGVTRFCVEPRGVVQRLPKVGGTKDPDVEKIVALAPDLVLANAEENRREDVETLRRSGVRVFVTYPRTVADVVSMVGEIGTLTGTRARAAALARRIEAQVALLASRRTRVRVFCPIWKNPWMSCAQDTYADDLLARCGADNVCRESGQRYPVIDLQLVAELDPEVILLPDEPYRFSRKDLPDLDVFAQTSAGKSKRVYFVSGKELTWFGPRTPGALRYFSALLGAAP